MGCTNNALAFLCVNRCGCFVGRALNQLLGWCVLAVYRSSVSLSSLWETASDAYLKFRIRLESLPTSRSL